MAGLISKLLLSLFLFCIGVDATNRSFVIDPGCDCFLKDGQPFRYVSGSLHYFRVPRPYWKDRMLKMKAAGLNALQTYVEWSGHEPEPGKFYFEDDYDLISFLQTAMDVGLLVIFRPGPYICAERDFGGFPYWLLRENSNMNLRTHDSTYLTYVDRWFDVLLPMMKPLLYENGGPIIWVQVENEYGQTGICDFEYMVHLREKIRQHLGPNIPLFRTDIPRDTVYMCDNIDEVYVTADFGAGTDVSDVIHTIRLFRQHGPLVATEYYPGWMDHWGEPHANVNIDRICKTLDDILAYNGSVNFYMFHGGTNFGFSNGANDPYLPQPTSYDYGAPLSEAGDPTPNYFRIREVIGKYMPLPPGPLPEPSPKLEIDSIPLQYVALMDVLPLIMLNDAIYSVYPLTFEELNQARGFVKYSTIIDFIPPDPAVLSVPDIRDRGYVFVNKKFVGVLSRSDDIFQMPLNIRRTQVLTIIVENQGRINSGELKDSKGIISNVTLGTVTLKGWINQLLILNSSTIEAVLGHSTLNKLDEQEDEVQEPGIYFANFVLPENSQLFDSFLDPTGFRKGVAFLNGFNLGRYWPVMGPQVTLYVPGHLFKPHPQNNSIVLFELEIAPCAQSRQIPDGRKAQTCSVSFVKEPQIDGPTPR